MNSSSPPSNREATLYYWGLPSCPRLVARSSTHVWEDPGPVDGGPFTYPPSFLTFKSFRPAAGDPLLHRLWNDATSSLRIQIVDALSAADWTAVDILRVGRVGGFRTTLLVSVKPKTLSWSQAHRITLLCKAILEEHGIDNVHCEIRESTVTSCASIFPRRTPPAAASAPAASALAAVPSQFQLSSAASTNLLADRVDLSDCLGTRISMKDDDTRVGTKGIYLSLKPSNTQDKPKLVALACQHVVGSHESRGLRTRLQGSRTPREAIQIDQPEYNRRFQRVDDVDDLVREMKPYADSSSRTFGTLLYSPEPRYSRALRDTPGYDPWLRDWALIELLPSRHQAPLGTLTNNVFVGPVDHLRSIVRHNMTGWRGYWKLRVPVALTGTVRLSNAVVPMSELFKPAHGADDDEPTMLVAQSGAGGQPTVGLGNSLKSLVRRDGALDGGVESYSEEWAITSLTGIRDFQTAFSSRGDSGSCVWDIQTRRPAAIIMAGVHGPLPYGNNDVTYAQPLERLLDDIRGYGFDVSLV